MKKKTQSILLSSHQRSALILFFFFVFFILSLHILIYTTFMALTGHLEEYFGLLQQVVVVEGLGLGSRFKSVGVCVHHPTFRDGLWISGSSCVTCWLHISLSLVTLQAACRANINRLTSLFRPATEPAG